MYISKESILVLSWALARSQGKSFTKTENALFCELLPVTADITAHMYTAPLHACNLYFWNKSPYFILF